MIFFSPCDKYLVNKIRRKNSNPVGYYFTVEETITKD